MALATLRTWNAAPGFQISRVAWRRRGATYRPSVSPYTFSESETFSIWSKPFFFVHWAASGSFISQVIHFYPFSSSMDCEAGPGRSMGSLPGSSKRRREVSPLVYLAR